MLSLLLRSDTSVRQDVNNDSLLHSSKCLLNSCKSSSFCSHIILFNLHLSEWWSSCDIQGLSILFGFQILKWKMAPTTWHFIDVTILIFDVNNKLKKNSRILNFKLVKSGCSEKNMSKGAIGLFKSPNVFVGFLTPLSWNLDGIMDQVSTLSTFYINGNPDCPLDNVFIFECLACSNLWKRNSFSLVNRNKTSNTDLHWSKLWLEILLYNS